MAAGLHRMRLNRGGDRQANAAFFRAVLIRLRWHLLATAEGRTEREVIRYLASPCLLLKFALMAVSRLPPGVVGRCGRMPLGASRRRCGSAAGRTAATSAHVRRTPLSGSRTPVASTRSGGTPEGLADDDRGADEEHEDRAACDLGGASDAARVDADGDQRGAEQEQPDVGEAEPKPGPKWQRRSAVEFPVPALADLTLHVVVCCFRVLSPVRCAGHAM